MPGPLLVDAAKAQQETANTDAQLAFLTHLVTELGQRELRESHVLQLQRLAIEHLYECGGTYRDVRWRIRITESTHKPPEATAVPSFVREAVELVNASRGAMEDVERAAYALWRFNWIHPFRGGNGRTARAIAYLILCMELGAMIPGTPTLPSLIAARRDDYLDALRAADRSVQDPHDGGAMPDLSMMTALLDELVRQQFLSAIADMIAPPA